MGGHLSVLERERENPTEDQRKELLGQTVKHGLWHLILGALATRGRHPAKYLPGLSGFQGRAVSEGSSAGGKLSGRVQQIL